MPMDSSNITSLVEYFCCSIEGSECLWIGYNILQNALNAVQLIKYCLKRCYLLTIIWCFMSWLLNWIPCHLYVLENILKKSSYKQWLFSKGQRNCKGKKRVSSEKKYSGSPEYLYTDIIFRPPGCFRVQTAKVFNKNVFQTEFHFSFQIYKKD